MLFYTRKQNEIDIKPNNWTSNISQCVYFKYSWIKYTEEHKSNRRAAIPKTDSDFIVALRFYFNRPNKNILTSDCVSPAAASDQAVCVLFSYCILTVCILIIVTISFWGICSCNWICRTLGCCFKFKLKINFNVIIIVIIISCCFCFSRSSTCPV